MVLVSVIKILPETDFIDFKLNSHVFCQLADTCLQYVKSRTIMTFNPNTNFCKFDVNTVLIM